MPPGKYYHCSYKILNNGSKITYKTRQFVFKINLRETHILWKITPAFNLRHKTVMITCCLNAIMMYDILKIFKSYISRIEIVTY